MEYPAAALVFKGDYMGSANKWGSVCVGGPRRVGSMVGLPCVHCMCAASVYIAQVHEVGQRGAPWY